MSTSAAEQNRVLDQKVLKTEFKEKTTFIYKKVKTDTDEMVLYSRVIW